jgi:hypothetical protein
LLPCSSESEAGSAALSSSVPDADSSVFGAGSSVPDVGSSEVSGADSPSVSVGDPLSETPVSVGSGDSPESVELGSASPVSVGSGASPESVAVGSFVVAGPEGSDSSPVGVGSVPVVVVFGASVAVELLSSVVEVDTSEEALEVGLESPNL